MKRQQPAPTPSAAPSARAPRPLSQRAQHGASEPLGRAATPALQLSLPVMWLVLSALVGAVLLNLHHAALWCAPLALIAAAWRARSGSDPPKPQSSLVRILMVVVLTGAALVSFRSHGSLGAAATLLVVMAAMKLSETSKLRDWLIIISAALFLLLAACLDAQNLWRLPLYAVELWLLCTALYALGAGTPAPPLRALLKSAATSLSAALPLAVLLFLFFPRLAGSIWAIPQQDEALTGLGDELTPGSITKLVQSDEPALRVRFDDALPPALERYWRGPVLHDFDGYTWRRRRGLMGKPPRLLPLGVGYHYEVTLEPNEHDVLIALELPQKAPDGVMSALTQLDYQLITPRPLLRTLNYRLVSYPSHRNLEALTGSARQLDLTLPVGRNPRALQLAHQLRARAANDGAYVSLVLDYLRHGGYRYTLTPAPLDLDSVDDLLFHTREGFCGHYASAFATLMRAGGVPARVVTGYLGGEWNRFGHYLLIRQSDAHAWTEVWLDGHGWTRVDPTSVVDSSLGMQLSGLETLFQAHKHLEKQPWLRISVQAWQAMNAWWQDRVISFNMNKQLDLLGKLGLGEQQWRGLIELLAVGGALWLALIAWGLRPHAWRQAQDPLSRCWRLLERKLGHEVAPRAPHEGPIAFAERVSQGHPELARRLHIFARRYAQLRYGPTPTANELEHFRRAVRQWQPHDRLRPGGKP
jgi:transglutaminase-like putative cysteine protease